MTWLFIQRQENEENGNMEIKLALFKEDVLFILIFLNNLLKCWYHHTDSCNLMRPNVLGWGFSNFCNAKYKGSCISLKTHLYPILCEENVKCVEMS